MTLRRTKKPGDCGEGRLHKGSMLSHTPYWVSKLGNWQLGKQQLPGILVGGKYPGVCLKFMANILSKLTLLILYLDI